MPRTSFKANFPHNVLLIKKQYDELKEKPFSEKQFTTPKESIVEIKEKP